MQLTRRIRELGVMLHGGREEIFARRGEKKQKMTKKRTSKVSYFRIIYLHYVCFKRLSPTPDARRRAHSSTFLSFLPGRRSPPFSCAICSPYGHVAPRRPWPVSNLALVQKASAANFPLSNQGHRLLRLGGWWRHVGCIMHEYLRCGQAHRIRARGVLLHHLSVTLRRHEGLGWGSSRRHEAKVCKAQV